MDIREFLTARLDEEARDADLISSGGYEPQRWRLGDGTIGSGDAVAELTIGDDRYVPLRAVDRVIGGGPDDDEDSDVVAWVRTGRNEHLHVQRHDPARVLRDVQAKRRILEMSRLADNYSSAMVDVLLFLAWPFAGHPDYNPAWDPSWTQEATHG